jgi:RNA polymerase sigma-70 factor (ECF subfamily)
MPPADTRALYDLARRGSPENVNAFYERCARKLLPLIRLRLGRTLRREMESRDILQAVLCKSIGRLDNVKEPAAVMAWLARIADNEIRDQADYYKRRQRDAAMRAPIEDAADVPAPIRHALSQAIVSRQTEALEAALEELGDAQREIIVLRKLEELTFPEIASRLGKSEDACRMAFSRAMAALTLKLAGPPKLPATTDGR